MIDPATNLADGKKVSLGQWHNPSDAAGTLLELLGTQLDNLVTKDKAMALCGTGITQELFPNVGIHPQSLPGSAGVSGFEVTEIWEFGFHSSRKKTQPRP